MQADFVTPQKTQSISGEGCRIQGGTHTSNNLAPSAAQVLSSEAGADAGDAPEHLADGEDRLPAARVHEEHGADVGHQFHSRHRSQSDEEVLVSRVHAQAVEAEGDDNPVEGHDEKAEEKLGLLGERRNALLFPFHHFVDDHIARWRKIVRLGRRRD